MTKLLKSAIDFANLKGIAGTPEKRIAYLADIISHMADRDERTEEIIALVNLTTIELMGG